MKDAPFFTHECGTDSRGVAPAADMPGSGVQACATSPRETETIDIEWAPLSEPISTRLASAASAALFGMPRSGELVRVLKDIRKHRKISEEWIVRYQRGEPAAGTVLLLAHAPLVAHVARRFCRPEHRDWEDCLQQGSLGVLTAADRFDPRKAAPSTYIVIWVRNRIRRWLQDCAQGVRIPVHQYDKKADGVARAKLGSPKTRTFSSMAQTHHERTDLEFEDTLVDHADLIEDQYAEAEQLGRIATVADWFLSRLTPVQAEVLRRRTSDPEETLKEIGDSFDRSRERIRQIEEEALGRCRVFAARRKADPEDSESFAAWLPKIISAVMDDTANGGAA